MAPKKVPADKPVSRFTLISKGFLMPLRRFLFNVVAAPAVVLGVALFTVGLVKTTVELIRD